MSLMCSGTTAAIIQNVGAVSRSLETTMQITCVSSASRVSGRRPVDDARVTPRPSWPSRLKCRRGCPARSSEVVDRERPSPARSDIARGHGVTRTTCRRRHDHGAVGLWPCGRSRRELLAAEIDSHVRTAVSLMGGGGVVSPSPSEAAPAAGLWVAGKKDEDRHRSRVDHAGDAPARRPKRAARGRAGADSRYLRMPATG
jgi:hypothetical protein